MKIGDGYFDRKEKFDQLGTNTIPIGMRG